MSGELSHPVTLTIKRSLASLKLKPEAKILVGVSGGVDSMVLLYILHKLGHNVTAAHVNFNLRGEESYNDALFVKLWCRDQGISSYELDQDTQSFAFANNLNTQSAAREIRYEWWDNLVATHQFDYVATGHHLDDTIETVFLNLLRGTGLKGMKGIPPQRDVYIRPLLECSRREIEAFALHYEIPFRTDSSNLKQTYQRNRLRHQLIPMLEELSPGFHSSMKHTLHRVNLEWEIWEQAYHLWQAQNVIPKMDGFLIPVSNSEIAFLLRWLEEKGIPWNLTYDFLSSSKPDTGNTLTFDKYKLSRTDTGYYFEETQPAIDMIIHRPGHYSFGNFDLTIELFAGGFQMRDHDPLTEFVSAEVIRWPLHVRNVHAGDYFQPIGMQGKSKKIQDFMVDQKMELYEKERLLLLTNPDHIIWVIGRRLDERAKVKADEKGIYKLQFIPTLPA